MYRNFIKGRGALGLLLVRLVVGLAFMFHGWSKIQQPFDWMGATARVPGFLQALAAVSEFGGGLALVLGLLTPLVYLGLMATMVGALVVVHLPAGHPFVAKGASYELALVYLTVNLLVLLIGPGVLSLDAMLFKNRRPLRPAFSRREKVEAFASPRSEI